MTVERFWKKVDKRTPDECWPWLGSRNHHEYGMMNIKLRPHEYRRRYAHRLSYELAFGSIPAGLNVLHRCDNPACVNPQHLFTGTQKDNISDMMTKGRQCMPGLPRRTHCFRGHEFTEQNTYTDPHGHKHCRTCGKERQQ